MEEVTNKKTKINLPTKITIARICMIPVIIVSYILQKYINVQYFFLVTAALYFVAAATDFLDGYLARKNNQVTSLGKFLDPIADKMLVVLGLVILIHGNYIYQVPFLALIGAVVILAREFIIGLIRQMAALKNRVVAADKLGKIKTLSTMCSLTWFLLQDFGGTVGNVINIISTITFIIAIIFTVWSGINYVVKNKDIILRGE